MEGYPGMNLEAIYKSIIKGEVKACFCGRKDIKNYLCYVLGNDIDMHLISLEEIANCIEPICIYDDITEDEDASFIESKNKNITFIKLSEFVIMFNNVCVPKKRKVALWGGGAELKTIFDLILKQCQLVAIIDKQKQGDFEGIPFVRPEAIDYKDYFIIITTTKFASEVKEILNSAGQREGTDYILGSSAFLNDNAGMFVKTIADRSVKRNSCRRPFDYVNVGVGGNLTHCCYQWLPKYIGSVFGDGSVTDTIASRIIRVSFMNQTYSFCNTVCCPYMSTSREDITLNYPETNDALYMQKQKIVDIDVAFDNTCNLFCESCRNGFIVDKSNEPIDIANKICNELYENRYHCQRYYFFFSGRWAVAAH